MNNMKKIIYTALLFLCFIPIVSAETVIASDNLVNIYLFHSDSCKHCQKEIKLLDELEEKYDNIKIYKYEISKEENIELLMKVGELFNAKIT